MKKFQAIVDSSLFAHPKLKKLARQLDESRIEAVGQLSALWCWASEYAPEGIIESKFDALDIADAAEYPGSPDSFVDALLEAGFLDLSTDGVLAIHDWQDYTGQLVSSRAKMRERKAVTRARHREV